MNFAELGRYLQDNRKLRERTLEDVVNALKIRRATLEAFERGEFNISENKVQVRGMLRTYAEFLELNSDLVLQYYEEAHNPTRKRRTQEITLPVQKRITDTPPAMPAVRVRRPFVDWHNLFTALGIVTATVIAIGVIVLVAVEFIRTPDDAINTANVPEEDRLDLRDRPPTATYTASWTPRPAQPTATPPFTGPLTGQGLQVIIVGVHRSWVQVRTDGVEQYANVLAPEQRLEFTAISRLDITLSSASGASLTFNGQPRDIGGLRGQRVDIVYTTAGVEIERGQGGYEPTPEISATPIPTDASLVETAIARLTPTVTPGPSPTASNTPTITPTPSDTPTPTETPTETLTPSPTFTPSNTPTMTLTPTITFTPSMTAILPPRATATGQPPTKSAGN